MKTLILVFCMGCGVDSFYSISPMVTIEDSGVESGTEGDSELDASQEENRTFPPDTSVPDSTPDAPQLCKDPNDVEFEGKCFYLDGSGGLCDGGYARGSNQRLGALLWALPDAWKGKNYRHQVSDNACVWTSDQVQNFGMVTHANKPGPFGAGEPVSNGSSCTGVYFTQPKQLTFCEGS